MKTVLLLGGGGCQKNGAAKAREKGLNVVVADYLPDPPAARLAAAHVRASSFDTAACLAAAREHRVDGVFTLGTDQPVLTAAAVSEALGLACPITPRTALAVTNKRVMKEAFRAAGIPTVRWKLVSAATGPEELRGLRPPLVIKPLDSQGQRGIFKVQSAGGALEKLPETLRWSREKEALVEEFYPSDEVTVSAWVEQGRATLLTVTDRLLYDDPVHIGVCTGHRFPSVHMGRAAELDGLCQRICAAFGIEAGPLYVQVLVGAEGILVNEVACRVGGAFEDVTIPYLTGFDILGAVIDQCLGRPVDTAPLRGFDCTGVQKEAAVPLLFCRPGFLAGQTPLEELKRLPGVLEAGYNYRPGDRLEAVENATARYGWAVVAGPAGTVRGRLAAFYRALYARDEAGRELVQRTDVFAGAAL